MKALNYSWMVLLTFIASVNTSFAETVVWSEVISSPMTSSQRITVRVPVEHHIETRSIEVPANIVATIQGRALRVANHHGRTLQLKGVHLRGEQVVVIGQRLVSRWTHQHRQPSVWVQEVRMTFPRHYLTNSWDVNSLERELERLGIKVKPKPSGPKPTQQLSG